MFSSFCLRYDPLLVTKNSFIVGRSLEERIGSRNFNFIDNELILTKIDRGELILALTSLTPN